MTYSKILGLTAMSAMALMALVSVNTASATTLEVGGTTKNESVSIAISLKSETSGNLKTTAGAIQNTCTESTGEGSTNSPFTGEVVAGGNSSSGLNNCTRAVTVHNPGKVEVEWRSETTDGTVISKEAEVTTGSILGTLKCTTGKGTDVGLLTGVSEGDATMHINAIVDCGFVLPSAILSATYTVTSPEGLGVSS
ncbi:MAG TPA: hypothetical protein VFM51_04970 [Solirubrobacterales bacterium]|nr:hypothetical protein [Solirubrobacterales bacterium]